jgi:hypothetical protein
MAPPFIYGVIRRHFSSERSSERASLELGISETRPPTVTCRSPLLVSSNDQTQRLCTVAVVSGHGVCIKSMQDGDGTSDCAAEPAGNRRIKKMERALFKSAPNFAV